MTTASSNNISPPPPSRKHHRIFLWVFVAVQGLFLVWIIAGAVSAGNSADCTGLDKATCDSATAVGTGIGVALVIGLWFVTDAILGIIYGIYRLAKRP